MQKYLLTWYGMTDFRASLGFENTSGPVLSALLSEDYSEVVILGFTDISKASLIDANDHNCFYEQLKTLSSNKMDLIFKFLDQFSNTKEAHENFVKWLNEQLDAAGKRTTINFRSIPLKQLNDTEGIYDAAIHALDLVAEIKNEKCITLYLSPGTPVMAFVWAFAALRYPNIEKKLIASSQPNKPPEEINLPIEWLEWHSLQVKPQNFTPEYFDVIFHLFGEQRMPNLLGVIQFSSKKHIFLTSKKFPADVMKNFMGNSEFIAADVDPYDPENVSTIIIDIISKMPSDTRIGFNLTGGTKLMYAGALWACRKINATPFYFNSKINKVVFLNDFSSVNTKQIDSVEWFIKLNSNELVITKNGKVDEKSQVHASDRKELTNELWRVRSKISKLYNKLIDYNTSHQPFEIYSKDIYASLSKEMKCEISIGDKHYKFENWPDLARYLSGGWFEEFIYLKLQRLLNLGIIKDLRLGLEVSIDDGSYDKKSKDFREQLRLLFGGKYQEFDICFTDGRRLYIVECKAGSVKSDHIMKLENIIRYFGGIEGRAVLASCFSPNDTIINKKIKESRSIELVSGDKLLIELENIIKNGVG